jgi:high frequency lysogenization protein
MAYSDEERLTALAGVYQAAWCAQAVARRGMADSAAMEACIYGVFQTDAPSVAAVFGGTARVAPGLRQIVQQLKGTGTRDIELTRYVVALLQLERKLDGDASLLPRIAEGIEQARGRLSHYPLLHQNILAQLAEIYRGTVSTLQPRIMVRGEALHLRNPDNANRVRALLLAGVRSARLWFQVGGRRTQLLLGRRRLLRVAEDLLQQIESPAADEALR